MLEVDCYGVFGYEFGEVCDEGMVVELFDLSVV